MSWASDTLDAKLGYSTSNIVGAASETHDTCAGVSVYTGHDESVLIQSHEDGKLRVDAKHEPMLTVADVRRERKRKRERPALAQLLQLDDPLLAQNLEYHPLRVPKWLWERVDQLASKHERKRSRSKVFLALTVRGLRELENDSANFDDD